MIGCLGVIPGTVAFVFIGASTAGTMNEEVRGTVDWCHSHFAIFVYARVPCMLM